MLKKIDNLSPPITLFYRGYDRHASSFSGILSIITYLGIIILGLVFSMDFLLKKNPTAYYFTKFTYDIGFYPFNHSGIFHFLVIGEQTEEQYDNKVFTVIGINEEYNTIKDNINIILYDHWIYENCTYKHIGYLEKYLDKYNDSFHKGLCISKFYNKTTQKIINYDENNFTYPALVHGSSNTNGNTYGIFLLRCQNHSELGKNNCYEKKICDKKGIDSYSFSLYFIDQFIDVTNYHYPLTRFYNKVRNQIVLSSFTINHLNFNPLHLITHSGIIINLNSEIKSFNFDVNEKFTIEENDTGIYGSFYFWMQNQEQFYDRTYQKIQDVCASISGISKLLMIIGYLINYLIAEITLIKDLSYDITKKVNKFGKKNNTRGFKLLKMINFSMIMKTDNNITRNNTVKNKHYYDFCFNTPKNNTKNNNKLFKKNTLRNNMVNDSIFSKMNLKEKNSLNKSFLEKKVKIFKILYSKLFCKNTSITQLQNLRIKVLSEEKLFTSYFILGALSDIFLKKFLNRKENREIEEFKQNKL